MTISPLRLAADSAPPLPFERGFRVSGFDQPHILLVDDDEVLRSVQTDFLKRFGFHVDSVPDGDAALEFLVQHPVDLVITDMVMPRKDGVELIRLLRKQHPLVKLIAMSGGGSMSPGLMVDIARVLGVDATLAKPFTLVSLLGTVRDVLRADSSK